MKTWVCWTVICVGSGCDPLLGWCLQGWLQQRFMRCPCGMSERCRPFEMKQGRSLSKSARQREHLRHKLFLWQQLGWQPFLRSLGPLCLLVRHPMPAVSWNGWRLRRLRVTGMETPLLGLRRLVLVVPKQCMWRMGSLFLLSVLMEQISLFSCHAPPSVIIASWP